MSARTPEEVHPLFARHFAAADLAGLLSLYEPDAVLLPQPGVVARGPRRDPRVAEQLPRDEGHVPPRRLEDRERRRRRDRLVDWTLDAKAARRQRRPPRAQDDRRMRPAKPTAAGSSRSTARSAPACA
jgi:hypothetical protein